MNEHPAAERKATRAADVKSPLDRAKDAATAARETAAAHPYAAAGIVAGAAVATAAGVAYAVTRARDDGPAEEA